MSKTVTQRLILQSGGGTAAFPVKLAPAAAAVLAPGFLPLQSFVFHLNLSNPSNFVSTADETLSISRYASDSPLCGYSTLGGLVTLSAVRTALSAGAALSTTDSTYAANEILSPESVGRLVDALLVFWRSGDVEPLSQALPGGLVPVLVLQVLHKADAALEFDLVVEPEPSIKRLTVFAYDKKSEGGEEEGELNFTPPSPKLRNVHRYLVEFVHNSHDQLRPYKELGAKISRAISSLHLSIRSCTVLITTDKRIMSISNIKISPLRITQLCDRFLSVISNPSSYYQDNDLPSQTLDILASTTTALTQTICPSAGPLRYLKPVACSDCGQAAVRSVCAKCAAKTAAGGGLRALLGVRKSELGVDIRKVLSTGSVGSVVDEEVSEKQLCGMRSCGLMVVLGSLERSDVQQLKKINNMFGQGKFLFEVEFVHGIVARVPVELKSNGQINTSRAIRMAFPRTVDLVKFAQNTPNVKISLVLELPSSSAACLAADYKDNEQANELVESHIIWPHDISTVNKLTKQQLGPRTIVSLASFTANLTPEPAPVKALTTQTSHLSFLGVDQLTLTASAFLTQQNGRVTSNLGKVYPIVLGELDDQLSELDCPTRSYNRLPQRVQAYVANDYLVFGVVGGELLPMGSRVCEVVTGAGDRDGEVEEVPSLIEVEDNEQNLECVFVQTKSVPSPQPSPPPAPVSAPAPVAAPAPVHVPVPALDLQPPATHASPAPASPAPASPAQPTESVNESPSPAPPATPTTPPRQLVSRRRHHRVSPNPGEVESGPVVRRRRRASSKVDSSTQIGIEN